MKVTLGQANTALDRACVRLQTLSHMAFAPDDKRTELLAEKLSHEVYGLAVDVFGLKSPDLAVPPGGSMRPVELTDEELSSRVSYICGRVLTYVELTVPIHKQCKAFKSLAGDIVWDIAKDIRKLSEAG